MIITRVAQNMSVAVNVYSTVLVRAENDLRARPELPMRNTLRYMKARGRQNTAYLVGPYTQSGHYSIFADDAASVCHSLPDAVGLAPM